MDFQFIQTLSFIAFTLILVFKYKARTRRLPPGPWKLPIIGNLHQLGDSSHKSIQRLSQQYGPMMFLQLGAIPTLVISSADAAMAIFKGPGGGHDLAFSGRPTNLYVAKKLSYEYNSITFAPYGELWREMRKIAITELLSSKRVQSFRTIREEEVAAMVNHIDIASSSSAPVNLKKLSLLLSNDVVCRVTFGKKYGGGGDDGTNRFDRVLHDIQHLVGEFVVSDYFPWMWWVNKLNGMETRVEKNFEELDKLYDEVIADHVAPTRTKANHEDIVDVLLRLQKDARQLITLDNQQIKGVLSDMFIAGTDTTASALVWTFTELIRNPPSMEKVKYEDCVVEDYEIPAKTRVIINAKSIGTDPKYWENPHDFRPDRFMKSSVDFKGQHLEFFPFGVGRRGCPGTSFAIMLLQLVVANCLYRFDWKLPEGMSVEDVDMEEELGITVFKKTPLCLVPIRVV
ncbi:hypothetical protein GOBAR_AA37132 [Gossypium barbadense]|uniref:Cytochrome P450 n=1 Tax=Gossypium barbadense TaxID=3634 RepID=A0A2P5VXL6_GOSBA|nr:hypothetical protein GOBAR_AA37132 [Gossypium barbadense]